MAGTPFDTLTTLPDELDAAHVEVYTEAVPNLGGRWLVWGELGKVMWERPDGKYQPSMFKPDSFNSPQWIKV